MSDQVVTALNKALNNSYVLYFKTHSYHWNVEGPMFKTLHDLFEEQYTEIWEAIDDIAERIRALKAYAPNNTSDITKDTEVKPAGNRPDANQMIIDLAEDNMTLSKVCYDGIKIAEEAGDEITTDMLIERATVHEKNAWMLRSLAA